MSLENRLQRIRLDLEDLKEECGSGQACEKIEEALEKLGEIYQVY